MQHPAFFLLFNVILMFSNLLTKETGASTIKLFMAVIDTQVL